MYTTYWSTRENGQLLELSETKKEQLHYAELHKYYTIYKTL